MRRTLARRILVFFLALMMAGTVMPTPFTVMTVEAAAVKNGWVRRSGKWYFYKNGKKTTGWVKVSGKWYYMSKKNGVMQTGWQKLSGKWYFLDKNGAMQTGWVKVSGKWYYMNSDGAMKTGWITVDDVRYYLKSGGAMVTGWQTIGGKQYYFRSSGAMHTGFRTISGKKYYFGADGVMVKSDTLEISGTSYTFDGNGVVTAEKKTATESTTVSTTASTTTTKQTTTTEKTTTTTTAKQSGKYTADFVKKNCGVTGTRAQFVADIANAVVKYAPQYGIKVYSPIIAQAIHESAWGESTLGAKYHNYFGMKCGTAWTGKSVNVKTTEEYTVGTISVIRDNFRVYDNLDQGVKGYFEFIQKTRYANLKGVTSPRKYLENIKADGYATGSQYVNNNMRVITTYNLTVFDPK